MNRRIAPGSARAGAATRLAAVALLLTPLLCGAAEITSERIRERVEACARNAFASRGEATVRLDDTSRLADLFGRDLGMEARLAEPCDAPGPVLVVLDFLDEKGLVDRRVVSAEVRVLRDVLVAGRKIGRNETIGEADLRLEKRDVRTCRDRVFSETADIAGLRARRPLAAGEMILGGSVEAIPIVQRGERVTLEVRFGAITATVVGKALEDGAEGEWIRVENSESGKRVRGLVIAAGRVRAPASGGPPPEVD